LASKCRKVFADYAVYAHIIKLFSTRLLKRISVDCITWEWDSYLSQLSEK